MSKNYPMIIYSFLPSLMRSLCLIITHCGGADAFQTAEKNFSSKSTFGTSTPTKLSENTTEGSHNRCTWSFLTYQRHKPCHEHLNLPQPAHRTLSPTTTGVAMLDQARKYLPLRSPSLPALLLLLLALKMNSFLYLPQHHLARVEYPITSAMTNLVDTAPPCHSARSMGRLARNCKYHAMELNAPRSTIALSLLLLIGGDIEPHPDAAISDFFLVDGDVVSWKLNGHVQQSAAMNVIIGTIRPVSVWTLWNLMA